MNFDPKKTKVKKGIWVVFPSLCKGCGICLLKCPKRALSWGKNRGVYNNSVPEVDPKKCELCGICETFCPDCAIITEKK